MDPISFFFFFTFQNPGKNDFSRRSWPKIGLRNSQADLGLDAAQFGVVHTLLFDEINDSVVNSERGELVRGSNPPLVHSAHSTAGDL